MLLGGFFAAAVGIVFGIPSLRIKGFYLAVATLAAQFFIVWALVKFGWFSNHSSSGVITAQKITLFGYVFDSPAERYVFVLTIVSVMALAAKNMVRSSIGRAWMAVRDMDVAAEVVGIPMMKTTKSPSISAAILPERTSATRHLLVPSAPSIPAAATPWQHRCASGR